MHLVGTFSSMMIIAQEMYYIEMFSLPTVFPGIIPISGFCHLYENTSVRILTHTGEEESKHAVQVFVYIFNNSPFLLILHLGAAVIGEQ